MTYPAAGNAYPPLSGAYAAPAESKKPGAIGIILGIVLIVAGFVGGVAIVMAATADIRNATAYPADDQYHNVNLPGGQKQGIWINNSGKGRCDVEDSSGTEVTSLAAENGSQSVNGWTLAVSFTPDTSDTYQVGCHSDSGDFSFKVAPLMSAGMVGAGVAVMGVGGLAGLVLIIVTAVRRSSWTRKHNQALASPWGQPPTPAHGAPGAFGAYGQTPPSAYGPATTPAPGAPPYGQAAPPSPYGSAPQSPASPYGSAPQTPASPYGSAPQTPAAPYGTAPTSGAGYAPPQTPPAYPSNQYPPSPSPYPGQPPNPA